MGLYNGQGLYDGSDEDIVTYSRINEGPDHSFIRLLLYRGRLQGAVLIGDTGEQFFSISYIISIHTLIKNMRAVLNRVQEWRKRWKTLFWMGWT